MHQSIKLIQYWRCLLFTPPLLRSPLLYIRWMCMVHLGWPTAANSATSSNSKNDWSSSPQFPIPPDIQNDTCAKSRYYDMIRQSWGMKILNIEASKDSSAVFRPCNCPDLYRICSHFPIKSQHRIPTLTFIYSHLLTTNSCIISLPPIFVTILIPYVLYRINIKQYLMLMQ